MFPLHEVAELLGVACKCPHSMCRQAMGQTSGACWAFSHAVTSLWNLLSCMTHPASKPWSKGPMGTPSSRWIPSAPGPEL